MTALESKAREEADKLADTFSNHAHVAWRGAPPCESCAEHSRYISDALVKFARAFGEKCIRASLSEYEIHARGTPARLIELTIAAAEKSE